MRRTLPVCSSSHTLEFHLITTGEKEKDKLTSYNKIDHDIFTTTTCPKKKQTELPKVNKHGLANNTNGEIVIKIYTSSCWGS